MIETLVSEYKEAGEFQAVWNADETGSKLASGVYFAHLKSGGNVVTQKILLLK